ncbi:YihY/virulence factor BrkB family protein [Cytophaga sp. FL35]|uniref:YihY/virulence factor BrkB family protein n=1 Tax=Cytophaga sp. FL35 TaxID=1904456 RepID=UPI0016539E55|nr:YihY/virulence factor BrkB family protein [Cytophaga sp. FL35]MBC7000149.1 YihY/virulence factor BrkB family protein [Cytophaga sp. FL35]
MIVRRLKTFFILVKKTALAWVDNDPFGKSAVVAYYALFSLPSLLMMVAWIAGSIYGVEAVKGKIVDKIGGLIGEGVSEAIEGMIANASVSEGSTVTVILGGGMLLFGATGVFVRLKMAMNDIWGVESKKKVWIQMFLDRMISFGMVLVLGFLFLISLVLSVVLKTLSAYISSFAPDIAVVIANFFSLLLPFLVITGLFAALFRLLPDVHIRWKTTFWGAGLTTALFLVGEYLLGYYFTQSDPTSVYGGASSVVLILLWVYYTCIIMFFGAEFTYQYANFIQEKVEPNENGLTKNK